MVGRAALLSSLAGHLDRANQLVSNYATTVPARRADLAQLASRYEVAPTARLVPQPPPPPKEVATPVCYIVTEDGDAAALCGPDTTEVTYFDDEGNYTYKNLETGEVSIMFGVGPHPGWPESCHLPSAGADREAICGPDTTNWNWVEPDGTMVTEELLPNGETHIKFRTPPGPLVP